MQGRLGKLTWISLFLVLLNVTGAALLGVGLLLTIPMTALAVDLELGLRIEFSFAWSRASAESLLLPGPVCMLTARIGPVLLGFSDLYYRSFGLPSSAAAISPEIRSAACRTGSAARWA